MNGYRLYYMDRFSGHIDHRRDFVAAGDTAAIEVASGWTTDQPMELWQARPQGQALGTAPRAIRSRLPIAGVRSFSTGA